MKRSHLPILIIPLIVIIDQIIKLVVKTNMCLYEKISVASWFQIFFTENEGMAFGMSFIGTMFLAIFRIIAIGVFAYLLYKVVKTPTYPKGLIATLSAIIAGAIGNLIDNMFYGAIFTNSLPANYCNHTPAQVVNLGEGYAGIFSGKVVDMFYFPLFKWPDWMPWVGGDVFFSAVFNFADAAISVAAVCLLLFYNRHFSFNTK